MRDSKTSPHDSVLWPLIYCYALIDIKDGKSRGPMADSFMKGFTLYLRRFPAGRAWYKINTQAKSLRSGRGQHQLETEYHAQLNALLYIAKESPFHDYLFGILALDSLRILTLIYDRQGWASNQSVLDEDHNFYHLSDNPNTAEEIAQLKLSRWQRMAILLSGNSNGVLTRWQGGGSKTNPDESRTDGQVVTSLSAIECMPVTPPATLGGFHLNKEVRNALAVILGEVQKPAAVSYTLDPEPTSVQTTNTQPKRISSIPRISPTPTVTHITAMDAADMLSLNPALTQFRGLRSVTSLNSRPPEITSGEAEETMGRNTTTSSRHGSILEPELRAQPTHVPEANINHGRNAFSGYFMTPSKRSGSPTETRPSKLPRFGIRADLDNLRLEMTEDLRTQVSIQGRRL